MSKRWLRYILVFVLSGVLLITILKNWDIYDWNNGYHTEDNGRWIYIRPVDHGIDTEYLYRCDVCDKLEEFDKKR